MATVREVALAAKAAAPALARATSATKNAALAAMADSVDAARDAILAANGRDVVAAREAGTPDSIVDRLALDGERLAGITDGLRDLVALDDPVGEIIRGWRLPNGLEVRQVRVPLGVVAMVYEARPNVTVDAAGLALKSGNACILRGSSSAINSNVALANALRGALRAVALPPDLVGLVEDTSRESVKELGRLRGVVDLLIPRGGAGLINAVVADAQVPTIETGVGVCHVYVDADADLDKAQAIVVNAKAQRPSVCNAAETLLVHRDVAEAFLPPVAAALRAAGVDLVGDESAQRLAGAGPALEEDWETEYLDLKLSVRVVGSAAEALAHIARFGTHHTEAIVTENRTTARDFTREVDAAAVMVNASTRFTDGGEFGFGAEIGISTQKLHARGPMGLTELTTTKYVVEGDGQTRS